jgi:hypothetical protein
MPQPSRKQLIEQCVRRRCGQRDQQRHARATDAVEEAEHGPHRGTKKRTADAREPEIPRQLRDVAIEAEWRQELMTRGADGDEQRRRAQRAPECGPYCLPGHAVMARPLRLRHDRLHRRTDAPQHIHHYQHQPLHRTDRRQRRGGDPADEPHVGEIQDDLYRTVGHQWQRQAQHRALVHVCPAVRVQAQRRQARRPASRRWYQELHRRIIAPNRPGGVGGARQRAPHRVRFGLRVLLLESRRSISACGKVPFRALM